PWCINWRNAQRELKALIKARYRGWGVLRLHDWLGLVIGSDRCVLYSAPTTLGYCRRFRLDARVDREVVWLFLLWPEIHRHSVRAGLGASFTHLIPEASLAGGTGGVVIQTIVRCCRDHNPIAVNVDVDRGRPRPFETRCIYVVHLSPLAGELDLSTHRSVEPVNLIGIHAFNTENLSYPVCAAPDVTARIPQCRSLIRLQHS